MRSASHFLCCVAVACCFGVAPVGQGMAGPLHPVQQTADSMTDLMDVLQIDAVLDVMRLEGLRYGSEMEADLFPGKGGAAWQQGVALIYDLPTMRTRFEIAFAAQFATGEEDIPAIIAFFGTDLGQRILTLEVDARTSLMDEAVEDAAAAQVDEMMAEAAPRFGVLQQFADVNELIDMNVSGAMNSNLAFFMGMAEVGGFARDMSQQEMLMDVWSQEPDIRAQTESWIYPYLVLAYGALSEADMAKYLAFSQSPAGRKLNLALFGAFDQVFASISHDLGRAAASRMIGEDI
ncbi:DUF2059 domain-containing protein [Pseudorhodobacter turbinis]|uniref:DUF2059 domain-containing protein n=1 Tax=Pseudorhodobacter turbinis TaxID=2500533 RepID=A0A4P8EDH5_9RHOB|nr:DUF2059 domain-containing protein [Pseudorhodobacter turbinis]QCO55010.1 DUF2059 domain-containing protein [Pseudorhodobacter turbinis]